MAAGGAGPAAPAFAQPGDEEVAGELVEVDSVAGGLPAGYEQRSVLPVEVVQEESWGLVPAQAMHGDQGDDELGHRSVGAADLARQSGKLWLQPLKRNLAGDSTFAVCRVDGGVVSVGIHAHWHDNDGCYFPAVPGSPLMDSC